MNYPIHFHREGGYYVLDSPLLFRDIGITGVDYAHPQDTIRLRKDGTLVLRTGYRWNGRTVAIDTANALRSSAAHDALYRLIEMEILEPEHKTPADKLMRRIDKEDGVMWFRRMYSYWALRVFGRFWV